MGKCLNSKRICILYFSINAFTRGCAPRQAGHWRSANSVTRTAAFAAVFGFGPRFDVFERPVVSTHAARSAVPVTKSDRVRRRGFM
jgi:hypothetical protein